MAIRPGVSGSGSRLGPSSAKRAAASALVKPSVVSLSMSRECILGLTRPTLHGLDAVSLDKLLPCLWQAFAAVEPQRGPAFPSATLDPCHGSRNPFLSRLPAGEIGQQRSCQVQLIEPLQFVPWQSRLGLIPARSVDIRASVERRPWINQFTPRRAGPLRPLYQSRCRAMLRPVLGHRSDRFRPR